MMRCRRRYTTILAGDGGEKRLIRRRTASAMSPLAYSYTHTDERGGSRQSVLIAQLC